MTDDSENETQNKQTNISEDKECTIITVFF